MQWFRRRRRAASSSIQLRPSSLRGCSGAACSGRFKHHLHDHHSSKDRSTFEEKIRLFYPQLRQHFETEYPEQTMHYNLNLKLPFLKFRSLTQRIRHCRENLKQSWCALANRTTSPGRDSPRTSRSRYVLKLEVQAGYQNCSGKLPSFSVKLELIRKCWEVAG